MDARTALRKLVGSLLLAVGSLVALSCGLCTGYVGILSVTMLFDRTSRDTILFTSPFLIAGLVAVAVGFGIAWLGLHMLRDAPPRSPDQQGQDR